MMNSFFSPLVLGNLAGSFMFLVLGGLLLIQWRGRWVAGLLILASFFSALLFFLQTMITPESGLWIVLLKLAEIGRNAGWLGFLYLLTRQHTEGRVQSGNRHLWVFVAGLPVLQAVLLLHPFVTRTPYAPVIYGVNAEYVLSICMALLGLRLLEQLFRGMSPAGRWAVKFICFGLGGIFVYDLFLYSNGILFRGVDGELIAARGVVNAMCVPLIVQSVVRIRDWDMSLFISRHVIYHGTTTLAAGIYLLIMAAAGYYVRNFGGDWGGTLQIAFLFGGALLLLVIFFSAELRARLRIFLTKHFYRNKYDYREEWLGFARTLAESNDNTRLYNTIIKAVTDVVKSPGGALWLEDGSGHFALVEKSAVNDLVENEVAGDEPIVKLMQARRWILEIEECRSSPDKFDQMPLPGWINDSNQLWVILPLFNADRMIGFMILVRPHGNVTFDWEDRDLLKTVGYQTAAYIALLRTSEALSEARQFETFNRLSAFMVHDIKNVMAQLTFITSNYPKYRDNREFMNDAIDTITHATGKMKKLLGYLGRNQEISAPNLVRVDVEELVRAVIERRRIGRPAPQLRNTVPGLLVHAEKDKLVSALEHLIRNAQEATGENGSVWLSVEQHNDRVLVSIGDDGCGMDEQFIKNRLFKPFDTTKGNAGMGIGVYESREIVREIGGNMKVISRPGEGTVFTIDLPLTPESTHNQEAGTHE